MEFNNLWFSGSTHDDTYARAVFNDIVIEHHLVHTHEEKWTPVEKIQFKDIAAKFNLLASSEDEAVFWLEEVLVKFKKGLQEYRCIYAAKEFNQWQRAHEVILNLVPEVNAEEQHKVPIDFWYSSYNGGSNYNRKIEVPSWKDIVYNYNHNVVRRMEHILSDSFNIEESGRLLLWHGVPGTGKTYAIRALTWEWRKWCKFHYITDSDKFFSDAEYMLKVLFDEEYDHVSDEMVIEDKWNLIIIEDAGELIAADAKERVGQGLSRLLNTVDGLLGQGLKVLVLITTNEPLRKMHDAVVRKGRIASEIEFKALSNEEARRWLDKSDLDTDIPINPTLARLYALKAGDLEDDQERDSMGFG